MVKTSVYQLINKVNGKQGMNLTCYSGVTYLVTCTDVVLYMIKLLQSFVDDFVVERLIKFTNIYFWNKRKPVSKLWYVWAVDWMYFTLFITTLFAILVFL